jgi:3-oxoacyl-[acyl-carrier-protein] synthase-1
MGSSPQSRGQTAPEPPIVVTGVGLVTAVGRDAPSTTAAVRADITFLQKLPEFVTPEGAQATGGAAIGVTDDRSGSDRLVSMAIFALQEALAQAEESSDLELERGCLLLGLAPSKRPSYEPFEAADVATLLEAADCAELANTHTIETGHTAGLRAIAAAADRLRDQALSCCIVGAVDSFLDYPILSWLDESGRLKTDQRDHGFIPGEAAAFLVIERAHDARDRGARVLASILAKGFATEPHPLGTPVPSRAEGLTQALRTACATSAGAGSLKGVLCDLNGELYRMREWAMARGRALPELPADALLWHPADCYGDVGAASGAALAAIAATAFDRGWLDGPLLVSCSADEGDRGVLVVGRGAA